jgi:hypothetical protein
MTNKLLTFAGTLVILVALGHFYGKPLLAQVRAVLMLNVDDPGRTPYQFFLTMQGSCPINNPCQGNVPAVPVGKRLVLTNITGFLSSSSPGGTLIQLGLGRSINVPMTFSGPLLGSNFFTYNQQGLAFYDGGDRPRPFLLVGSAGNTNNDAELTLSGYLLDCTAGPCNAILPPPS